MNKLQGFYELQSSGLPTVPWKEYTDKTILENNILWTVRTAIWNGNDLNLPREIGVKAEVAEHFANTIGRTLGKGCLVIYYPYFVAEKSGVLEVKLNGQLTIEATRDDLWNLVTYNNVEVTISVDNEEISFIGDEKFLTHMEIEELAKYAKIIERKYKHELLDSKSIFLEWSYAYESNINMEKVGTRKLLFYELRSVR